jgi:serine/threonine protein kinase
VEVELLAKLSHPNLVSYRHVWLESVRLSRFGPTVACAFILQQYCNGGDLQQYIVGSPPRETSKEDLKDQIRRRSRGQAERPRNLQRKLSLEEIYSLFRDITSGLAYLHDMGYIHRDLKPSNCLLHQEGGKLACLISDFGEVQHTSAERKSTGATGTVSWCAPEVLRPDEAGRYGEFTTKSDVFSLGMILYFLCFGRLPYASSNAVNEELEDVDLLRGEIADWKGFDDSRRERPDLPTKLYQLLKSLLEVEPHNRPSAAEVLSAIRGDSGLDGALRGHRTPDHGPGLRGRRIQNLDSPMHSSSPTQGKD